MYQSVIVAVDGSKNSVRAAEEALKLQAQQYTLLSVISHEDSKDAVLHSHTSSIEQRKALIQEIIHLYERHHVNFDVRIEHGVPKETIIKVGNSTVYDMLVMGSRGLNAIQEMVMGSVSHKVVKEVKIPVLIVK
ncbi:universal stress protein [Macrococcoides caseolyticum]|uniref:universal stress protein n=1 Tax=Macrococcoides caseolyticum TaxID=69966 RepID=UPI001F21EAE1|nr:universal stress protein [Macrococcus caseolyticus]MCE4957365.1 universal stress protein [Macrococcus caseolyticus]